MDISKPYTWSCVLFITGIGIGPFAPSWLIWVLFGLSLMLMSFKTTYNAPLIKGVRGFLVIVVLALGIWRYQWDVWANRPDPSMSRYSGAEAEFIGTITDAPRRKSSSVQYVIKMERLIKPESRAIEERIVVNAPLYPRFSRYQRVRARCGDFQILDAKNNDRYARYWFRYDVYSQCRYPKMTFMEDNSRYGWLRWFTDLKDKMESNVNRIFHEPYAGLLNALMLGNQSGVEADLMSAVRKTGLAHIIVVSGFHVTLFTYIVFSGLSLVSIPRRAKIFMAVAILFSYMLLLDFAPAALRGFIMGGILLLAYYSGRPYLGWGSLMTAAAAMLAVNPRLLLFDIGFQLFFLATIGILYLHPLLYEKIPVKLRLKNVADIITMTFSAMVMVTPLAMYYFGNFSLAGLFANIAAAPVITLMMTSALAVLAVSFFSLLAAQWVGLVYWIATGYFLMVIDLFAAIPFASVEAKLGLYPMLFIYMLIFIGLHWRYRKKTKIKNYDV